MNRKETSYLIEKVADLQNLEAAAIKATKNRKRVTKSERYFFKNKEKCLKELRCKLLNGTYKTSKYYHFKQYEPKERIIAVLPFYPDRIVHHAILNVTLPLWYKKYTADTYNCIKNRGTHGMVKKLKRALSEDKKNTEFALQLDVRHFYESIDHEILKQIVRRTIKDPKLLLVIFEIIDSYPNGVPIGNVLSQFLANLFLAQYDHYVKEKIGIKHYFRYCDDLLSLSSNKKKLWILNRYTRWFMRKIKLELKPNGRIFPTSTGIDIVGYVFYPTHTRLRKRTKQNFIRKCRKARKMGLKGRAFKRYIGSYLGLLKYANCINLAKKYLGDEYDLCMKKFKDIADEKDRFESYHGKKIQITDVIGVEIIIHGFRNIRIGNKDKVIISADVNGELSYFFTGSAVIMDRLNRYKHELPFIATIEEVTNKYGRKYYTLR